MAPITRRLRFRSSNETTPEVFQEISTAAALTALPIMVMSGPSNWALDCAPENNGSKINAELTAPNAVPSRGARLAR